MRYRESGSLDTSGVQDRRGRGGRGGGGRGLAVGGGGLGLVGLVVVVLLQVLGGGDGGGGAGVGGLAGLGQGQAGTTRRSSRPAGPGPTPTTRSSAPSWPTSSRSRTTGPATLGDQYVPTDTVFFSGSVQTSCGGRVQRLRALLLPGRPARLHRPELLRPAAVSSSAPRAGCSSTPTCIAHEYGHHVQNLLGTNAAGHARARPGPTSGTVRLELQADCYAGAWANHAETVPDESGEPLIAEITAGRHRPGARRRRPHRRRLHPGEPRRRHGRPGRLHPRLARSSGRSGSRTGYETGDPARCDTFATDDLG